MTTELTVAITDLVRFCHRRGDIDHRFSPSPTGEQGIAGHQRLYARRPASYLREFPVRYSYRASEFVLILGGRADGYDPQRGLVEEIKTCRVSPGVIPEAVSRMHMAQGRLYAAIIAAQEDVAQLEVRLTWFNIDTDEEVALDQVYTREELQSFLEESLAQFSAWLDILARLVRERDRSLASLQFPHGEFRPGQREIAELTYKCIDQGGQLLLEAPTGIGKTAAVLYPALKALATGKHDRIVFTTAKTTGRRTAEETMALLRDAGYRGTALSLTARDKICLSPGKACHGDDCPYARGYYDKLPLALEAAVSGESLRREDVEALARRFEVCPYQLALDLLPWVDVVIADLHYIYSLTAGVAALMRDDNRRWSVLVDEAHNLPGRARGMYSAGLAKERLMKARAASSGAATKALAAVNRQFLRLQKEAWQEHEFDSRENLPDRLIVALQTFTAAVSEQLATEPTLLQRQPPLMDFFFDVLQFLRVGEQWGDEYRFEMTRGDGKQSLRLALNCLAPARLLAQRQAEAHATTAFSATLSPLHWTRDCLGLRPEAVCSQAASPFASHQLQVLVATNIDTRYRQRGASLPALAACLQSWLVSEPGNCIVYFPSYRYMQGCVDQLASSDLSLDGREVWLQQQGQEDSARAELLQLLSSRQDVVAFCILGGVFGEGIDLPGEQLTSVVVVGVGLPRLDRDTRQLQAWYEERYGAGFEYAFLYPGMQKVDQALGRVVRRMDDHGRALLIDSRYTRREYRELLPSWWQYCSWPGPAA